MHQTRITVIGISGYEPPCVERHVLPQHTREGAKAAITADLAASVRDRCVQEGAPYASVWVADDGEGQFCVMAPGQAGVNCVPIGW